MKPLCRIDTRFKTYFIEWSEPIIRSFAVKRSSKDQISKAFDEIWHRRYAHMDYEAVHHLESALKGVQVIRSRSDLVKYAL
jgi:hypothetical protein